MNIQEAREYKDKLIEIGFSSRPFGDEEWLILISPDRQYTVHAIFVQDSYLDDVKWPYDRIRIWENEKGIQFKIPAIDKLSLSELDILSLTCSKCGELQTSIKKLTPYEEMGICKKCNSQP